MNLWSYSSTLNNVACAGDQTVHDLGVPRRSNDDNAGAIESIND
jgi:hypothetical protein